MRGRCTGCDARSLYCAMRCAVVVRDAMREWADGWAEEWVDGVMYGWVCGKTKGFIKTKSLGWMV